MSIAAIKAATWLHGTDAAPFATWRVPPPPVPGQELRVPHTGLYFTKDLDAARQAGPNVCSTTLTEYAKILDATAACADTENLRKRVLKNPIAQMCVYAQSSNVWASAWQTGEVLRFASSDPRVDVLLIKNAAQYRGFPPEERMTNAKNNWTRGWIELIVVSAAEVNIPRQSRGL